MTLASWVHFGEENLQGSSNVSKSTERSYAQALCLLCGGELCLMRTESWKRKTRGTASRCLRVLTKHVVLCGSRRTPVASACVGLDTRVLEKNRHRWKLR